MSDLDRMAGAIAGAGISVAPHRSREALALVLLAGLDAGLGVGHIWTAVSCPAYRTPDGADCTCNNNGRE